MKYNAGKLFKELTAAGLQVAVVTDDGLVTLKEEATAGQLAIIEAVKANHDPSVEPLPSTVDELKASKFFLANRDVIQNWIKTSHYPDLLKSILSRQSSQVDIELISLLQDLIQEEIDSDDVELSAEGAAIILAGLSSLI